MSLRPVQLKHLRNLFQVGTDEQVTRALEKIHPSELTILFGELNETHIKRLVDCLLLVEKAGTTLKELPEFILPDILELIELEKLIKIINRLDLDDATYLLSKIPENKWQSILEGLEARRRVNLEKLLLYPEDSAGSVMNPSFFSVGIDKTVADAIKELQSFPERETVFYVYIVDSRRLEGVIPLRNLVIADPKTPVRDIMKKNVIKVLVTADQEEAAQTVSQYNLLALPVVDENQHLLGVIAVDDVIDIFEEEATEDIYHMAGLSDEDRAFTPVMTKIKKRSPWLLVNLTTAFLSALVILFFEATIAKVAALAAYMHIIAGLGGNGGIQSMVVITRSIALGEMEFSRVYQAIGKEMLNGLGLGIIGGVLVAIIASAVELSPFLGMIVFVSMLFNMIFAGFMGASVPLVLKWLKQDPAVGSGVFVTTIVDITGVFIFLGLATIFIDKL